MKNMRNHVSYCLYNIIIINVRAIRGHLLVRNARSVLITTDTVHDYDFHPSRHASRLLKDSNVSKRQ